MTDERRREEKLPEVTSSSVLFFSYNTIIIHGHAHSGTLNKKERKEEKEAS